MGEKKPEWKSNEGKRINFRMFYLRGGGEEERLVDAMESIYTPEIKGDILCMLG